MKHLIVPLLFAGWVMVGCGKPEAPPAPAKPASAGTLPSLALQSAPAGGDKAASSAATQGANLPSPPPIDFATATRTSAGHGPETSDLDLLNNALERYRNAAPPPGTDPAAGNARELKDFSQLVKAGVIKSMPAPPAGKQFAIDSKTGLAVLVDKK